MTPRCSSCAVHGSTLVVCSIEHGTPSGTVSRRAIDRRTDALATLCAPCQELHINEASLPRYHMARVALSQGAVNLLGPRLPSQQPLTKLWNSHFTYVQLRYELLNSATSESLALGRTFLTFCACLGSRTASQSHTTRHAVFRLRCRNTGAHCSHAMVCASGRGQTTSMQVCRRSQKASLRSR